MLRLSALFLLCPTVALAQARLPADAPASLKRDLQTLQRYYDEVGRRTGNTEAPRLLAPAEPAAPEGREAMPAAPPPGHAALPERDPFDVTPELRKRANRRESGVGANLFPALPAAIPHMEVRALVAGPKPLAIVEIERPGERGANKTRTLTLREGDTITLEDGTTFLVKAIQNDVVAVQYGTDPGSEFLIR